MKRLTKEQILLLHKDLIDTFGGKHGLRDDSLLESALAAPFQTLQGESLFPSLQAQVTRPGYGLAKTTRLSMATSGSVLAPCWFSSPQTGRSWNMPSKN